MKQNKIYNIEQEVQKLVESTSYKEKNFDLKQEKLLDTLITYRGKKIKLRKLYDDILGYSDGTVICGKCNKKGALRKNRQYYEIQHGRSTKSTCYFGRNILEEYLTIPIRIINAFSDTV